MKTPQFVLSAALLIACAAAQTAPNVVGNWEGTLEANGTKLRLVVHLKGDAKRLTGNVDSPDQGALDIPIETGKVEGSTLHFDVGSVSGSYEGKLNDSATEVVGAWEQGGAKLPLTLKRVSAKPAESVASSPGISPGLSMKETEAWIKRELRPMGSDHIVTRYKGSTWGEKYEIESAVLSDCVLTIRQVSRHEAHLDDGRVYAAPNRQTNTSRITMKDIDVRSGLSLREDFVGPDRTASKPGYTISVGALSDRGEPFLSESDGYAGGKTKKSARWVRVRVRDQNMGNQAVEVFQRAAVLCGAPNQPVQTALAKATPETQSSDAQANPASPNGDFRLVSPAGYAASARVGKYVRKDRSNDSYFELAADGKIHLFQGGKDYNGNYSIQGDILTVQAKNVQGNGEHFVGNTIVEADGTVWEKANVQSETQSPVTNPPSQGPSKMTNDDVIQLVTAGLSEQVVITSIRQAPTKNFDLTTTGLIALKKAGVSDAVILVMQERAALVRTTTASEPKAPPKYDATLAAPTPKPAAAPLAQDGCSGVENMGLYKNEVSSREMGGGVVEWLAKIRNNTGVTKIVVFGWRDMYGQQQRSQVQIRGGDIASPRLDLTQSRVIPPVADLRVLSCE